LPLFSHEDKSKSQVVTIINTHETVEWLMSGNFFSNKPDMELWFVFSNLLKIVCVDAVNNINLLLVFKCRKWFRTSESYFFNIFNLEHLSVPTFYPFCLWVAL
jgi:hypothetical protein